MSPGGSPIKSPRPKSVATLFRFVARFARVRIEDSSFNRFALNGIQSDFFRGDFFLGGFYPVTASDMFTPPQMYLEILSTLNHVLISGTGGGGGLEKCIFND